MPSGPPESPQWPAPPESPPVAPQVVADWYPDPENSDQLRYWDGAAWTQHFHRLDGAAAGAAGAVGAASGATKSASGLSSIGTWMDQSFKGLFRVAMPLVKLHAMLLVPVVAFWGVLAWLLTRGARADLSFDGTSSEFEGISGVGVGVIVLSAALVVLSLLVTAFVRLGATRLVFWGHQGLKPSAGDAIKATASRFVRDFAWLLVFGLVVTVLYGVALGVVVGAFVLHWGPGIIAVLVVLAGVVYLFPRIVFIEAAVALPPKGLGPFGVVNKIMAKRWPPIAGRVFLIWLAATAASYAVQTAASFGLLPIFVSIADNTKVEFETIPSPTGFGNTTAVLRDGVPATSLQMSDVVPTSTFILLVMGVVVLYLASLTIQQWVFAAGTAHIYKDLDVPAAESGLAMPESTMSAASPENIQS